MVKQTATARLTRLTVSEEKEGVRLDQFLARCLNLSRKKAKELLDQRRVFVNNRRTWIAHHPLEAGDVIEIAPEFHLPPSAWSSIIYQDAHIIAVNKNPGYLSEGENSAEQFLRRQLQEPALRVVHRLDRETSGCLLLARTATAWEKCLKLYRSRKVSKVYLAVVHGQLSQPRVIRAALDGKPALSRVRPLLVSGGISLVAVEARTGRTHQVRRHLAMIGFPVVGDKMYATSAILDDSLRAVPYHQLHAWKLELPHPITSDPITITASPPPDSLLHRLLSGLKGTLS